MKQRFILIVIGLLLLNGAVWTNPVLSTVKEKEKTGLQTLSVSFLDVGQGDAIYIEAPNGHNMLVDAGPKEVVLEKLHEVMHKKENAIDVLVVTNPDADHISGFNSIIPLYAIGTVFEPGTSNSSATYKKLEELISEYHLTKLIAEKGTKIVLDEKNNIYVEILFPDRDVSGWTRNDGSIVGRLIYGDTSIMLMGDATTTTENAIMLRTEKEKIHSDILKLGHHGSRTSSGNAWLAAVSPKIAIISSGKNNSYGHPHQEVLDRLSQLNIPWLNTSKEGTITFESDGKKIERKEKSPR